MIYLDYNATAPVRPQVRDVMMEVLLAPANPSSVHAFGRAAKKILEDARKTIAESVSAFPNEVIFMGSGTEANTTALKAFADRRVIVSAVEHASVLRHSGEGRNPRQASAQEKGVDPGLRRDDMIPVDAQGIVDAASLDTMLAEGEPALVSIMLANNETGAIQPMRELADICKKHGALLHVDAVQGLGKIPVEFAGDMMTIAAHKMGGPVGASALLVRQDLAIAPLMIGGGQELNRRAGTENLAAIAGFAKAVEMIDLAHMNELREWLDTMEHLLLKASVFGLNVPRLPNTSCLAFENVTQEVLLMKMDLAGFALSAGSACSSGRIEPSHVLLAMGVDKALAGNAIRISGGWDTKKEDILKVTQALIAAVK